MTALVDLSQLLKRQITELREAVGFLSPREEKRLGGALLGVALAHLKHCNVQLDDVIAVVKRLWTEGDS